MYTVSTKTASVIEVGAEKRTRTLKFLTIERREQIRLYVFPKTEGFGPPASWTLHDGDIVVTCPRCGTKSEVVLGATTEGDYRIDARGVLFPSLLCPRPYCDFDHYVQLSGWTTMGALGRKKDNARGVIFYCMVWAARGKDGLLTRMPNEYTHAVSQDEARRAFTGLLRATPGSVVLGIAPAIDPHVAGGAENPGIIV